MKKVLLIFLAWSSIQNELAHGYPVLVNNFSFESPTVTNGGVIAGNLTWPGWITFWNPGAISNPANEFTGDPPGTLPSTANGSQYFLINGLANGGPGGIFQNVGLLQPNTTYTLTVAIGRRNDISSGQGTISLVNGSSNQGMVLASTNVDVAIAPSGSFADATVAFTTGPSVSGDLTIVLQSTTGTQIGFDNVRLNEGAPANATSVYVTNYSFEITSSPLPPGSQTGVAPPGWSRVSFTMGTYNVCDGIIFPNYTNATPPPGDGTNCAWANANNGIYQDVGHLLPNTTYTLVVAISGNGTKPQNAGASTIQLINGTSQTGTVLVSETVENTNLFQWTDYAASYTTGSSVVGDLTIYLSGGPAVQTFFDNVRLYTQTPTNYAPQIIQQPQSQTSPANIYATFNVGASGVGPFTYQWYSNNMPVPGANAASCPSPLTTPALSGTVYKVAVSNAFSGTISSNATLTVVQNQAPANLPIYTDNLVNGFSDSSSGTHNMYNTSPVHSGTCSISMSSVKSGNNLSFYRPANTTPYENLVFWVNGGTGGQMINVEAMLAGVGQAMYHLPALPTNTWEQFIIPLATLGVGNAPNFDHVLFESTSSGTTNTYYLDDIALSAAPAPALVHLTVNAGQVIRMVDPRMFGANVYAVDDYLDTPQSISLFDEIGMQSLRFPGGGTSDQFNWTPSTVQRLIQVATNINAQPFITVNYGSGTSNEAAAWVSYCNITNACAFKYWEIGNENYGTWETDDNTNPPYSPHTGWTYANIAANFIKQMKLADPTIKVGVDIIDGETSYVNGNTTHPAYNARTRQTNYGFTPVMLSTLKSLGVTPDFASYHYYAQYSTLYSSACQESDALLLQSALGSPWASEASGLRQQITDYMGQTGTNIELVVTENNSDGNGAGRQSTSLVNGLYYADSLGQLMLTEFNARCWFDFRDSTGTLGSFDPTLYGWRPFGDAALVSDLTNCYPEFYAAKLLHYFAQGGDAVISATSDYLLLASYAVKHMDGSLSLLVINKDVGATFNAQIALNGFLPYSGATLYSYGIPQDAAAEFGIGSQDIATNTVTAVSTNFSYSFPPLSLTLFTFPPNVPSLIVSKAGLPSKSQLIFQLQGQPGNYVLQCSTNLIAGAWVPVSTNMLASGPIYFTNSTTTGLSVEFWRAVWQP